MSTERFEERLLRELKGYIEERPAPDGAVGDQDGRGARSGRRSPWRLAGSGISVAATVAVAVVAVGTIGGSPSGAAASKVPAATAAGPLFHAQSAAFAIDVVASGAVDITILKGSEKPDVDALRGDLAKAGVHARLLTNVPTCRQLADRPGAPTPVESAQANAVIDMADRPLPDKDGDLVYSLDTSAATRGTTLWIMFSSTLSTIFVERTTDSGPQPNCLTSTTGS
jgi:hypothetical protein